MAPNAYMVIPLIPLIPLLSNRLYIEVVVSKGIKRIKRIKV